MNYGPIYISLYIGDRVIIIYENSLYHKQKGYIVAVKENKALVKIDKGSLEWLEIWQLDYIPIRSKIPIGEEWMNLIITDHAVRRWQKWISPHSSQLEARRAIREVFLKGYVLRGKEEKVEIVYKTYAIILVFEDDVVTVVTSYLITRPLNIDFKNKRGKKVSSDIIRSNRLQKRLRG